MSNAPSFLKTDGYVVWQDILNPLLQEQFPYWNAHIPNVGNDSGWAVQSHLLDSSSNLLSVQFYNYAIYDLGPNATSTPIDTITAAYSSFGSGTRTAYGSYDGQGWQYLGAFPTNFSNQSASGTITFPATTYRYYLLQVDDEGGSPAVGIWNFTLRSQGQQVFNYNTNPPYLNPAPTIGESYQYLWLAVTGTSSSPSNLSSFSTDGQLLYDYRPGDTLTGYQIPYPSLQGGIGNNTYKYVKVLIDLGPVTGATIKSIEGVWTTSNVSGGVVFDSVYYSWAASGNWTQVTSFAASGAISTGQSRCTFDRVWTRYLEVILRIEDVLSGPFGTAPPAPSGVMTFTDLRLYDGLGNLIRVPAIAGPAYGNLTSNPSNITAGFCSSLTWATSGASGAVYILPYPGLVATDGSVTISGTVIVWPLSTTQFTLVASNGAGSGAIPAPSLTTTVTVSSNPNILDPDIDIPRNSLDNGPSWIVASRRSVTAGRTILAKVLRTIQGHFEIPDRRIRTLAETDLTVWPTLETEQPLWALYPNYTPTISNFYAYTSSMSGVPYYLSASGALLSSPGLLITGSLSSAAGTYFLPLPTTSTRDKFWANDNGPKVLLDSFGVIWAKGLDRVRLSSLVATAASGSGAYAYTADQNAVLNIPGFPGSINAEVFDIPTSGSVWFRRDPNYVYTYSGFWEKASSWSFYNVGPPCNVWEIVLPQTNLGDQIDLVYTSQGRTQLLFSPSGSVVAFQGDTTFSSVYGYMTGPLYPADLDPSTSNWGVPSRGFISLFPEVLSYIKKGEYHRDRLLRLQSLMSLMQMTHRSSVSNLAWILSASLGRTQSSIVYPGAGPINIGTNLAILPELQDRPVVDLYFDSMNTVLSDSALSALQSYAGSVWSFSDTGLIGRFPLEARLSSSILGGSNDYVNVYSAHSPFFYAGRTTVAGLNLNEFVLPTTTTYATGSVLNNPYSPSLLVRDRSVHLELRSKVSGYRISGGQLTIRPGVLDPAEPLLLLQRAPSLATMTPIDAIDRGDTTLRIPGISLSSSIMLSITPIVYNPRWSDVPLVSESNGPPLDLDTTNIPLGGLPSSFPVFGSGQAQPQLMLDDPLAVKYT